MIIIPDIPPSPPAELPTDCAYLTEGKCTASVNPPVCGPACPAYKPWAEVEAAIARYARRRKRPKAEV